jgi:superfamily II RNA helicase
MEYYGYTLDKFQEKAVLAIQNNQSVLVAAPTGAGKTLIAEYALEKGLSENRRIIYTAPIKALSNQKFRDFTKKYGDKIGVLTGDVTINPDAQVLIMTTEIFRNTVVDNPERFHDVAYVIFDEVHYLDDQERGTVWEESIIFAPAHIKIIALSATIPNLHVLAKWIRAIRNDNIEVIEENERPVPLKHLLFLQSYGVGNVKTLRKIETNGEKIQGADDDFFKWKTPGEKIIIDYLVNEKQIPCLYFSFRRQDCELKAQDNINRDLLNRDEKEKIEKLLNELCQKYGINQNENAVKHLFGLVRKGIAFHHAGMLPSLKEIIEQLFTGGLIKLIFTTETFAVGVNMPARTVVFDELAKFNGIRRVFLKSREYQQMAGRAGRRGIDEIGYVYSKINRPYLKSAIVERITYGQIEPVRSQFNLSYATILNLYHTLKDKIYRVCEKSLSNFQGIPDDKNKKHNKFDDKGGVCFAETVEQVKNKIRLLSRLGYINSGSLTWLGHFARQMYGYELIMTELFRRKSLDSLSPDELNMIAVAIVFEPKSRDWYRKIQPVFLRNIRRPLLDVNDYIRREEKRNNIFDLSKEVDLKFSGTAYAWSGGADFSELAKWTNAADGDLVRTFRRAIQLLQELERAYRSISFPGKTNIGEAIRRLKRDEVDAEKYLRL